MMTSYSKQRCNYFNIYLETGCFLMSIRSTSPAGMPKAKNNRPFADSKKFVPQVEKPQPRKELRLLRRPALTRPYVVGEQWRPFIWSDTLSA